PNPFHSQTVFKADFPLNKTTLTMVNSTGQIVREIKPGPGNSVTIDRDNLPSGLYFIQLVENNRKILTKKIVIVD
ncbi:MAG TPA: T9SS type A sorting domain-containing protein, partial [Bacteroidia bacterium]|nr:T9SS type A sorting domain-containing protein [Bacteroidia bacterium]